MKANNYVMNIGTALLFAVLSITCSPNTLLSNVENKVQQAKAGDTQPVAAPSFTPTSGTFSNDQSVTISDATSGAIIYYTSASGSSTPPDPTSSSSVYKAPIPVVGNGTTMTIKAIAIGSSSNSSSIVSATFTINYSQVSTPQLSLSSGAYSNPSITLSIASTVGASILYTTDGSTPTESPLHGNSYSVPFTLYATAKVMALAYKAGMTDSTLATATYTLPDSMPTYSPQAGTYSTAQSVTLSTTMPGASIRYTTDGSTPSGTVGSLFQGTPISVGVNETLKAVAYESGWSDSSVSTAVYTLQVSTPTFTPVAGTYSNEQSVTVNAMSGASVRYTTDGTTPSETIGTSYTAGVPISVNYKQTLKAIAYKMGWTDSAVATALYDIPTIANFAGSSAGTSGDSNGGGIPTSALFTQPYGVAVDSSGNVYIADTSNDVIRKVSTGNTISIIAGTAGTPATTSTAANGDGGLATAALLNAPRAVAIDAYGNVYIADTGDNKIRLIDHNTLKISTFAGTGTAGYLGEGSFTPTSAEFSFPIGLAFDAERNLYIADYNNNRIRVVSSDATSIVTYAGNGTGAYSSADEGVAANTAEINKPTGIAFDTAGNLYIADYANNRIRKVSNAGIITTFAGNGTAGYRSADDGASATAAELNNPYSVAFDSIGSNLFIADATNYRIRKVSAGIITTYAGIGSMFDYGDGSAATAAAINHPYGVAFNPLSGNLYITATDSNRVRVVTP